MAGSWAAGTLRILAKRVQILEQIIAEILAATSFRMETTQADTPDGEGGLHADNHSVSDAALPAHFQDRVLSECKFDFVAGAHVLPQIPEVHLTQLLAHCDAHAQGDGESSRGKVVPCHFKDFERVHTELRRAHVRTNQVHVRKADPGKRDACLVLEQVGRVVHDEAEMQVHFKVCNVSDFQVSMPRRIELPCLARGGELCGDVKGRAMCQDGSPHVPDYYCQAAMQLSDSACRSQDISFVCAGDPAGFLDGVNDVTGMSSSEVLGGTKQCAELTVTSLDLTCMLPDT